MSSKRMEVVDDDPYVLFRETLDKRFKSVQRDTGSSNVLMFTDMLTARMAEVWTRVQRSMDYSQFRVFEDEREQWKNLWQCVHYQTREWANLTGIDRQTCHRKIPILIGNRMIYPDGTVHYWVEVWISRKMAEMVQNLLQE